MATKPISFAEFARQDQFTGALGGPNVVEPNDSVKNSGWIYNEYPPAEIFNWLHRYTYLWDKYLDSLNNEADNYFRSQY